MTPKIFAHRTRGRRPAYKPVPQACVAVALHPVKPGAGGTREDLVLEAMLERAGERIFVPDTGSLREGSA